MEGIVQLEHFVEGLKYQVLYHGVWKDRVYSKKGHLNNSLYEVKFQIKNNLIRYGKSI